MSGKRQIHREYVALVEGLLPDSGTIDAPIARAQDSAIMRCVDFERGESAVTHYERIAYEDGISAARIRLETGRTHQIRVHMSHIGHPLLGDFLYNPGCLDRPDCKIRRQALHSCRLSFTHPITGSHMFFQVEMPEDMRGIVSFVL
jgi:23S rRNA pseudouridine1911/1915/1917 synthase